MSIDDRIEYLRRKGANKRVSSRWYKKWWGILLALALAGVLVYIVSFLFLILRLLNSPEEMNRVMQSSWVNKETEIKSEEEYFSGHRKLVEGIDNNFLGDEAAEIVITVFSDFTCPYCKESANTIASLAIKYGADIKIIMRDYPILSDDSLSLALVARCAGEQDKYWPMYYKLFENQAVYRDLGIGAIVNEVGITDASSFYNCLDSQKYLNNVIKDASDAQFLKVAGTPAWFVNGVKVGEGAIPFSVWSELLDEVLVDLKKLDN
jgi:predicted DsbA family dithiol-disulfide isomerase